MVRDPFEAEHPESPGNWEYSTRSLPGYHPLSKEELDDLGGAGWELVAVVDLGTLKQGLHYIFKRPRAGIFERTDKMESNS